MHTKYSSPYATTKNSNSLNVSLIRLLRSNDTYEKENAVFYQCFTDTMNIFKTLEFLLEHFF